MRIPIKYFGLIAEITKCQEETISFSGNFIFELLETLHSKYPELKNNGFQVAQHRALVTVETRLTGEEIALLPPFSGG